MGLDIQGLDLAAWAAALKEDWLQAGRLFTRLELSGPPRDLRAQLKGRVEGLVVLDQGIGDLILEAVLKDRSITGQAEVRDQTLSLLKASGGIDLNRTTPDGAAYRPEWSSLKADVKVSDLDLARFGPAIKQVEGLAGRMNAEFILGPESKGWVRVEGLEFLVATTGQVVEKGNIRLGLKGSRVEIEECTAETGGGRLTGQGWLELTETIPFALSAELDKAEVLLGPVRPGPDRIQDGDNPEPQPTPDPRRDQAGPAQLPRAALVSGGLGRGDPGGTNWPRAVNRRPRRSG